MPPPTAIEPGVPYSAEDTEGKGYGSHMELELLAADEPSRTDSTNGVDARESDSAPALESLTAPASGEPPDATEPPSEAAPFEEYGLDLEPLMEPEADEPPDEAEPPREDGETAARVAEQVVKPPDFDPDVFAESESETIADASPEFEEASDTAESAVEGYAPVAPEIPEESEVRVIDDAAAEDEEPPAASSSDEPPDETEMSHESEPLEGYGDDFEALAAPESDDSPDEAEPPVEDEEPASDITEKALEESEPEPETPQESESEPIGNIVQDVEEPMAASAPDEHDPPQPETSQEEKVFSSIEDLVEPLREQTDEPSETSPVENGFLSLVRDSRGNWQPGKGFSRSELREAGLSLAEAARLGVRVDKRRRGAHPVNVAALEEAKSGV